jgi:hypothetical protein
MHWLREESCRDARRNSNLTALEWMLRSLDWHEKCILIVQAEFAITPLRDTSSIAPGGIL